MSYRKKILAVFSVTALAFSASHTARAADPAWPVRPVKFIVPSTAGGSPDRVTRMLAEHLVKKWGQPVIVDNKPGANSMIGTEMVAKSPADGYTLLSTYTSFSQLPALFKKMPYDTERDLAAVTLTVSSDLLFLVRSDSPYKTLQDFAAAAKTANPPLSYGTFGIGSSFHIYGENLSRSLGVPLTHVPYKGELPSTMDLLGGQLSSSFASVGTAMPFLRAGRLRALGVVTPGRSKVVPDVPTFAEMGVDVPANRGWFGVLAPAGTPTPVVEKLAADIREILARPEISKVLLEQGLDPVGSSPSQFQTRIHEDVNLWKKLMPEVGILPEG